MSSSSLADTQLLLLLFGAILIATTHCQEDVDYFRPGASGVDVLEARGFLAEEHFLETKDGYLLSVIRGQNPLLVNSSSKANREPLLFVHGIFNSAIQWISNSAGARPRDFSHLNASSMELSQLVEELRDEPSASSLPILAMNFGHEVWILNRRGTLPSQGRRRRPPYKNQFRVDTQTGNITRQQIMETVAPLLEGSAAFSSLPHSKQFGGFLSELAPVSAGPYVNFLAALVNYGHLPANVANSFDRSFWNYSLDEQAQFDLPATIDYIIERTGRPKVGLVGHSAGGALILMTLSLHNQINLLTKVSKVVLWSPAFNLGHSDAEEGMSMLAQSNHGYIGPVPLVFMTQQIEAVVQVVCNTQLAQRTICQQMFSGSGGQSTPGRQPVTVAALAGYDMPTCFNDIVQLAQWAQERFPRKFDYRDAARNLQAYGTERPPRYNLSQIQTTNGRALFLHVGRTDSAVSPEDTYFTAGQLTAPYDIRVIEDDECNFNHNGYFHHLNRGELVNLPTLRQLQSF